MSKHNPNSESPHNDRTPPANAQGSPSPDFSLDPFHKVIRFVSATIGVVLPAYFSFKALNMNENLPMQYSFGGEITREGPPLEAAMSAWGLGAIIVALAVLSYFPQIFNFPVKITAENMQSQYKNAVQMMIWVSVGLASIMVVMVGDWLGFIPIRIIAIPLVLLGVAIMFFITRMIRGRG